MYNRKKILTAIAVLIGAFILSLVFDRIILVGIYRFISSTDLLLGKYLKLIANFSWPRIGFWFIIWCTILSIIAIGFEKSFKYRYLFAFIIFIYLTLGQYHGSSLGFLSGMLTQHTEGYQKTTLLGINQGLRGDEWAVWLPLKLAQQESGFHYYNYDLMLEGCDTMLSGKLPSYDLMGLTRQKNWGYYFLPLEYAVSFEWWSSLFLLFMSSIDLMYELTRRKKLSVLYALIILFSPPVQWWNSLWVILYTGQYFLVLLSKFLNSQSRKHKIIYTALASVFAISYIFDLYPAWQVPFAYIFLIIGIWLFWKNRELHPFQKWNLPYYTFVVLVCLIFSGRFFILSKDAMITQLSTTYPGGEHWITVPYSMPLLQIINFFMAFGKYSAYLNNCEISQFFGMFLWSFVLWVFVLLRKDKRPEGKLLTALIICAISFLYFIYGPKVNFLYKVTLMSSTYPRRVYTAFGYCTILILFLVIHESQYTGSIANRKAKIGVSLSAIAIFLLVLKNGIIQEYLQDSSMISLFIVVLIECWAYIGYSIITIEKRKKALILLTLLTICSTIWVNPINRGIDDFTESTLVQSVKQIDQEQNHEGRWMVSGNTTISNIITACGVKRTTGTYIYPDWAMMEIIDPKHTFEDSWNRYAHINMSLSDKNTVTPNGPGLIVEIDCETARKLDIRYIVTNKEIVPASFPTVSFELLYDDSEWMIYHISY